MLVHYAAALCTIKNASIQNQDKCKILMQRIMTTTMKGLKLPGEPQELETVQQNLFSLGLTKMEQLVQN